jgi:enoyl-CoA hydratase/carnithine racemase
LKYIDFKLLSVRVERGVAFVDVDNPPVNLLTVQLVEELFSFATMVSDDDAVRVIVFQSANPDFFIAHFDVNVIGKLPVLSEEEIASAELGPLPQLIVLFRSLPKVTIGKLAGCARGGGSEFLLALDMRFAAQEKAILSQPEAAVGIIPGAGGTQNLVRLVGRARALEITLGCSDFSAELAERYGYINRALPLKELDDFVDTLAFRIASFPAHALEKIKTEVNATDKSFEEGMLQECRLFNETLGEPETRRIFDMLPTSGAQTPEFELEFTRNLFAALDKM